MTDDTPTINLRRGTAMRERAAFADGESSERSGGELLLVSRDRRFRAVMAALLSSRGFTVSLATRYPLKRAEDHLPAEIVVIDAGESLGGAEQASAPSGLMPREVAVVFVSDHRGVTTTRVVPKWHSIEQLCDEIELARERAIEESTTRARRAGHLSEGKERA